MTCLNLNGLEKADGQKCHRYSNKKLQNISDMSMDYVSDYDFAQNSSQCEEILTQEQLLLAADFEFWIERVAKLTVACIGIVANTISIPILARNFTNVLMQILNFLTSLRAFHF